MNEAKHVITLIDDGDAWLARLPGVGEVRVRNPGLASFELGQLVSGDRYPGLDHREVRLVDEEGEPVQEFVLLFNSYSGRDLSPVYARIRASPPEGCHWFDDQHHPGFFCVRRGTDRLAAIAEVVGEVRDGYGVTTELNDLGIEKLWEWGFGEDSNKEMVAHLLLMAAHRAELAGIAPDELGSFLGAVTGRR